jgi:hypothetical protein
MRRGFLLSLAAVVFGAAAFFGLNGTWPWHRLPSSSPAIPTPAIQPADSFSETLDTLRRGETLSDLFASHNVAGIDFQRLDPSLALNPRRLRPGLVFSFRQGAGDSTPSHIVVRATPEQRVTFRRISDGWDAEAQPIRWSPQEMMIQGNIDNSLYEALDAGVSDQQLDSPNRQRLAWDLADVYAWEIDFTRDIRPGDRFQVLFERLVSEDGEVRFGRVLASDLTIGGKSLTAFRFTPSTARSPLYFDVEGESLRRAFRGRSCSSGGLGRRVRQPYRAASPEWHYHSLRPSSRLCPQYSSGNAGRAGAGDRLRGSYGPREWTSLALRVSHQRRGQGFAPSQDRWRRAGSNNGSQRLRA